MFKVDEDSTIACIEDVEADLYLATMEWHDLTSYWGL